VAGSCRGGTGPPRPASSPGLGGPHEGGAAVAPCAPTTTLMRPIGPRLLARANLNTAVNHSGPMAGRPYATAAANQPPLDFSKPHKPLESRLSNEATRSMQGASALDANAFS
jgi:hypothetical protein